MLDIVGGTYFEFCQFPNWSELYGSGLRAAIALSKFSDKIRFYTVSSKNTDKHLTILSRQFKFKVSSQKGNDIIFSYLHPLSNPFINKIVKAKVNIKISAKNILRFGMLES